VELKRHGANLTCTCSCPAGQKRIACKHRLRILRGEDTGVVGGDVAQLRTVRSLVVGTDVEDAWRALEACEQEMEAHKARVAAAKRKLAQALDN